MTFSRLLVPSVFGACFTLLGCPREAAQPFFTTAEVKTIQSLALTQDATRDDSNAVSGDARAAALGQWLFFDTRLSSNGQVSCATCHDPAHGFADPKPLSRGLDETGRHAPTALHAWGQRWMFWDGRVDSLWAQATQPLENPREHGTNRLRVARLVVDDAELRAAYESIFGPVPDLSDTARFPLDARPIPSDTTQPQHVAWAAMTAEDQDTINRVFTNLAKCIAAYEERLTSRDSPFDRFAAGMTDGDHTSSTFPDDARAGLKLFVGRGQCTQCHNGPHFSDFEFHNLGLEPVAWMDSMDPGRISGVDALRADPFNTAGAYSDAPAGTRARQLAFLRTDHLEPGQFKSPTLRNVALTAPYMHGGHLATLEDVVRFYTRLPGTPLVGHRDHSLIPFAAGEDEIRQLVAFLNTLTGAPLDPSLTRAPSQPTP
jgi:cytochrome c peroxidase